MLADDRLGNRGRSVDQSGYVLNDQRIEIRFRCMELVFLKGLKPAAEELELFNPYQGQLPWDKAAGHDVKHRPHLEPTLIMSKGLPPLHHTPSYCDAYLNPGKPLIAYVIYFR